MVSQFTLAGDVPEGTAAVVLTEQQPRIAKPHEDVVSRR